MPKLPLPWIPAPPNAGLDTLECPRVGDLASAAA